jgi:hypothetical protein
LQAYDKVPGCKDFYWIEGYSAEYRNGRLVYRIEPIPAEYKDNAIRVFRNLQIIRDYFNARLMITYVGCMYRTPNYNRICGGAKLSKHLKSLAADVSVSGVPSMEVYKFARDNTEFKGFGIISEKSIHLDLRLKYWFYVYK